MLNINQFREHIIVPTLSKLQCYSKDAEELLVFTAASESVGGTYIKQIQGPALGIYQMEPDTYADIWYNYLRFRPDYVNMLALHFNTGAMPDADRLIYDLRFATAMARLHYRRVKERLPDCNDLDAMWKYYKTHYNTAKGKATKAKSIKLYQKWIGQELP